VQSYYKDDIFYASRDLEDYFNRSRIRPPSQTSGPVYLENKISSHLKEWTVASESALLSIAGSSNARLRSSQTTSLAAMYVEYAAKSELPVISYFCELSRNESLREGNTREAQALVALVSSLIRQLVELISPQFESEYDFIERFKQLDGTLKTWKIFSDILKDLLSLTPKVLFCVIDGFQWLDDNSTQTALKDLVKILRGSSVLHPNSLKTLVTTQGKSRCLLGELTRSELLYADHERAGTGAARGARGRRFIV
jgi:hypothetical protein